MLSISKFNSSSTSDRPTITTSPGLIEKDPIVDLPSPLRGLVEKELVTKEWATALSDLDQLRFTEMICDLVEKEVIRPSEVLKLNHNNLIYLEDDSSVIRSLVAERIINIDQLLDLEFTYQLKLAESGVKEKLDTLESRQKLKDGTSTLKELISTFSKRTDKVSSIMSTTSATMSTTSTTSTMSTMSTLSKTTPSSINPSRIPSLFDPVSSTTQKSSFNPQAFHPFGFYKMNEVRLYGGNYYLRRYPDVLWVLDAKELNSGVCRVYRLESLRAQEYPMIQSEIETFKTQIDLARIKTEMQKKKLESIKKPLSGTKPVDFQKQEARAIMQGEYTVAASDSEQPIIGTHSAGPCLIVALYDSKNKIAVIAHIDGTTDTDSFDRTLNGLSKTDTVAHLYGGDLSTFNMCMNIVDFLESEKIKLKNAEIVRTDFIDASLAIDARNGQIYAPCAPNDFIDDPTLRDRMMSREFTFSMRPITKI